MSHEAVTEIVLWVLSNVVLGTKYPRLRDAYTNLDHVILYSGISH